MADALPVAPEAVLEAAKRLAGHARRTPVLTSGTVDARVGATVFFKCESFQRMGAFKFRGAYNALSQLSGDVIAYSSGNHAQAVALAARELGRRAVIVMPDNAPRVKIEATKGYGGEVVLYDPRTEEREAVAAAIAAERGLAVVPPFDHPHIIAGQGTAALELFQETGPLDYLFVPCGGGGLLSGCALAAKSASPGCRVIGVEPAAGDDATRSFRTGTLQTCRNPDTIADGARTHSLGRFTFPLVLGLASDMTTVSDGELLAALRFLWERLKIVVEPTGALGAAGLFERGYDVARKRVGVVISGGNADLELLARMF